MLRRAVVPDVKSVYSMSGKAVTKAVKKACESKVNSPQLWDAFMYRTSIVRSELSLNDVSLIVNAFSEFPKYISIPFLRYLLEPVMVGQKDKNVSLADVSMILRNVERMKIYQDRLKKHDFFNAVKNLILSKLPNTVSNKDLINLVSVLRYYPLDKPLVSRIEGIVTNLEIEKLKLHPKSVIILLDFTWRASSTSAAYLEEDDEEEPVYKNTFSGTLETGNVLLLSRLFSKSIALSARFNHKDTLGFAKILDSMDAEVLSSLGHPSVQPIAQILTRLITRDLAHFKPLELVQLMNLSVLNDKTRIAEECSYRMREFRCPNAVKLLLAAGPSSKSLAEAVLARLAKYDAPQSLTPQDLIALCEHLVILEKLDSSSQLLNSTLRGLLPILKKCKSEESAKLVSLYTILGVDLADRIIRTSVIRRALGNNVVPPPFLFGRRLPQVSGVIRANEELSEESKTVLLKSFFAKFPFSNHNVAEIDSFEIVSDDTLSLAHDRDHIEAGAGLVVKTAVNIPSRSSGEDGLVLPCGIVTHCSHIGANNDNQNYHSNQAMAVCQHFAEDWIIKGNTQPQGLIITAHSVSEQHPLQLSPGYIPVNEVCRYTVQAEPSESHLVIKPLTDKVDILKETLHFPLVVNCPSLESFGLIDNTYLLCGLSILRTSSRLLAVDPFVTTDCPSGEEKHLLTKLVGQLAKRNGFKSCDIQYSGNDKFLSSILAPQSTTSNHSIVFSALPIGLDHTQQQAIIRTPWALSGLFQ